MEEASPVTIDERPSLEGSRVLVVEDGPTLTHGGMGFGAGATAARLAGATAVDPRPYAVGLVATPIDLARLIGIGRPVRPVRYSFEERPAGSLRSILEAFVARSVR